MNSSADVNQSVPVKLSKNSIAIFVSSFVTPNQRLLNRNFICSNLIKSKSKEASGNSAESDDWSKESDKTEMKSWADVKQCRTIISRSRPHRILTVQQCHTLSLTIAVRTVTLLNMKKSDRGKIMIYGLKENEDINLRRTSRPYTQCL